MAATNWAAFAIDEWNVISFRRSYFRIALAKPICAASVRASVLRPSAVRTNVARSAHALASRSVTPITTT